MWPSEHWHPDVASVVCVDTAAVMWPETWDLALTTVPICFSSDAKLNDAEYADFLGLATTYAAAPVLEEMSINITC
jgi:hypothetical protein